jgi:hypothetical protein
MVATVRARRTGAVGATVTWGWRSAGTGGNLLAAAVRRGIFYAQVISFDRSMGFGSYDESEQDTQSLDADIDEDDGVATDETDHDGDIEYDIGASNDELIDRLQDIKDGTEN